MRQLFTYTRPVGDDSASSGQHRIDLHTKIPVQRSIKDVTRRNDIIDILPDKPSITRLVGDILFEPNDEWQTVSRCVMAETFTRID